MPTATASVTTGATQGAGRTQYGKAPVFGTTIGHDNRAVADPVYLDTLARGVLWATGKFDDAGNPLPAYNRTLN